MQQYKQDSQEYEIAVTQYGADVVCVYNALATDVPGAMGSSSKENLDAVKLAVDYIKAIQKPLTLDNTDILAEQAYAKYLANPDTYKSGSFNNIAKASFIWVARALLKCQSGTPIKNAPDAVTTSPSNLEISVKPAGNMSAFVQQYVLPLAVGGVAVGVLGYLFFKSK
jgi:hypothetical protein